MHWWWICCCLPGLVCTVLVVAACMRSAQLTAREEGER